MSRHIKAILLLSAYAPALVIAGLLQPDLRVSVVLAAIAAVLVATLRLVLKRSDPGLQPAGASTARWAISNARSKEGELAAFFLGYLIPFLQWNPGSAPLAILALPALVAVVLYLNWHLGVFHLNPTLMFLGWRAVQMTESLRPEHVPPEGPERDQRSSEVLVLAKGRVPGPGETLPGPGWTVARKTATDPSSTTLWIANYRHEGHESDGGAA